MMPQAGLGTKESKQSDKFSLYIMMPQAGLGTKESKQSDKFSLYIMMPQVQDWELKSQNNQTSFPYT